MEAVLKQSIQGSWRGDRMIKQLEEFTPPNNEDLEDRIDSEVQETIRTLKEISYGSDEIIIKVLQAGEERLAHPIHKLCNKVWQEGTNPKGWSNTILLPIPKNGDLSEFQIREEP
jgi:hypothetical protein